MTFQDNDVQQVIALGREGFLLRTLPFMAVPGLLGLFVLLQEGPDRPVAAAVIMLLASAGFFAFTLWRWLNPADPVLELSPAGVRYRVTPWKLVDIPWDDVQGVESRDIRIGNRGIPLMERGVPVVLVARSLYDQNIHLASLWQRGPSWHHQFVMRGDLVQVAFFHRGLDVDAAALRAAIERRWRAFSRHPAAQASPAPWPAQRRAWLSPNQRSGVSVGLLILALPLMWWWQWLAAWSQADIPQGSRMAYVEQLLDGPGMPARNSSGALLQLSRPDVGQVEATACRKEIRRDPLAGGIMPTYEATWRCTAELRLTDGQLASGAFRLIIEYDRSRGARADARPQPILTAAPVSMEEAATILCDSRGC